MGNKTLAYITLLTGIAISGVAAYYSIIGLTTIFSGAFWSIVIMGTVLELGKLTAVSWLYNNWKITPKFVKSYLSGAIIILMLITSMGIFGFLSKAHIDQQVSLSSNTTEQIEILNTKLKTHTSNIVGLDRQIEQINSAIEKINTTGNGRTSLAAINQQKKTLDALTSKKQEEIRLQSDLSIQKIRLETDVKKIEAEIGPIKYVAELIYGTSDVKIIDSAIRWLIIIIIFIFDPLAILLLIAFNISINRDNIPEFVEIKMEKTKKKKETHNTNNRLTNYR